MRLWRGYESESPACALRNPPGVEARGEGGGSEPLDLSPLVRVSEGTAGGWEGRSGSGEGGRACREHVVETLPKRCSTSGGGGGRWKHQDQREKSQMRVISFTMIFTYGPSRGKLPRKGVESEGLHRAGQMENVQG